MIQLGCVFGRMTDTITLPPALTLSPDYLAAVFLEGSSGDIQLAVDATQLQKPRASGVTASWAYDLHAATRELTGNTGVQPVRTVAVLYADRYAPYPKAFGLMFDRGFVTNDDPGDNSYKHVPREACAVFLGAIAEKRGLDAAYGREVLFTTVHEMGHVFNLQHVESTPNFLATSPVAGPFDVQAYGFVDAHKALLASCSINPQVRPGGSQFGDSSLGGSHNQPTHWRPPGLSGVARLRIAMQRPTFWYWEPLELDLALSVATGHSTIAIPDELDPGYRRFRIWIESADGDRRMYRSPRHYCSTGEKRRIIAGDPFRRDISIFGESGGYTFRRPGTFKIWAEFDLGRAQWLRSNVIEVEVRSPAHARGREREIGNVLSRNESRALLYHRLDPSEGRGVSLLAQLCQAHPRAAVVPAVQYAMARALLFESRRHGDRDSQAALERRAIRHLERATGAATLGEHQRRRGRELIESLRS